MADPVLFKVFLSSPGDVLQERDDAEAVIKEINDSGEFSHHYILKAYRWDDKAVVLPMPVTDIPQKSVDVYMIRPSACDLVVVLFWSRMGSPMVMDEREYLSGTHYEYSEALQGYNQVGKPTVWLYRCAEEPSIKLSDPKRDEKIQQFDRVEQFFKQFKDVEGRYTAGVNSYDAHADFRSLLKNQLITYLRHLRDKPSKTDHGQELEHLLKKFIANKTPHIRLSIIDRWVEIGEEAISTAVQAISFAQKRPTEIPTKNYKSRAGHKTRKGAIIVPTSYSNSKVDEDIDQITSIAYFLSRYALQSTAEIISMIRMNEHGNNENASRILRYFSYDFETISSDVIRLLFRELENYNGKEQNVFTNLIRRCSNTYNYSVAIGYLEHPNDKIKYAALDVLDSASLDDDDTNYERINLIISYLKYNKPNIAHLSAKILVDFTINFHATKRIDLSSYFGQLVDALYTNDTLLQTQVLVILTGLIKQKTFDESVIQKLIELSSSPDEQVCLNAIDALDAFVNIGIKNDAIFDCLIQALTASNAQVRSSAAEVIGIVNDSRAIEPLVLLLEDKRMITPNNPYSYADTVNMHAASALAKLGDKRGIALLSDALRNFGTGSYAGISQGAIAERILEKTNTVEAKATLEMWHEEKLSGTKKSPE